MPQTLLVDYVNELSGQLSGKLDVNGPLNSPDMDGSFTFSNTQLRLSDLKALWVLGEQPITLTTSRTNGQKQIRASLQKFSIQDEGKNTIQLDGHIQSSDLKQFILDLKLKANNFLVMDTKEEDNELYHGHVRIDADGRLTGSLDSARVSLNVQPKKNSTFVYNYPIDQVKSLLSTLSHD